MSWTLILTYYSAYVLAILLVRGLGRIFWIPLLIDGIIDVCLTLGVFTGWDIRIAVLTYQFAFFVWVLVLAGKLTNLTFVAALLFDLLVIFNGIWMPLQAAGVGQDFWNDVCTTIMDVWMASTFIIVISVIFNSTVLAKLRGKYVDVLTNPKKRFLLPVAAHCSCWLLPVYFRSILPASIVEHRFQIAAYALVWGWVILELPFYIMYRRIRKQYA